MNRWQLKHIRSMDLNLIGRYLLFLDRIGSLIHHLYTGCLSLSLSPVFPTDPGAWSIITLHSSQATPQYPFGFNISYQLKSGNRFTQENMIKATHVLTSIDCIKLVLYPQTLELLLLCVILSESLHWDKLVWIRSCTVWRGERFFFYISALKNVYKLAD